LQRLVYPQIPLSVYSSLRWRLPSRLERRTTVLPAGSDRAPRSVAMPSQVSSTAASGSPSARRYHVVGLSGQTGWTEGRWRRSDVALMQRIGLFRNRKAGISYRRSTCYRHLLPGIRQGCGVEPPGSRAINSETIPKTMRSSAVAPCDVLRRPPQMNKMNPDESSTDLQHPPRRHRQRGRCGVTVLAPLRDRAR
jgi:hypothetical protein